MTNATPLTCTKTETVCREAFIINFVFESSTLVRKFNGIVIKCDVSIICYTVLYVRRT